MLITFLVVIENDNVLMGEAKKFIECVSLLDYPMSKVEIILVVANGDGRIEKKISGPPMIKILNYRAPVSAALNLAMNRVLGDVVVFSNYSVRFNANDLKMILAGEKSVVLGNKWVAQHVNINELVFPNDLECLRTFLLMKSFEITSRDVIGTWGKLSRKEILRGIYKAVELRVMDKIKLAWHYLVGKP